MNCWEFKKCGRDENGAKAKEFGVCPAYPDHGQHCAWTTGTLCGGAYSFDRKFRKCIECDFYNGPHFDKAYDKPQDRAAG